MEDRILYLPWSRNDDGFQATDPQVAWDRCPDPAHLLWVIYHAQRTAYGESAECTNCGETYTVPRVKD